MLGAQLFGHGLSFAHNKWVKACIFGNKVKAACAGGRYHGKRVRLAG